MLISVIRTAILYAVIIIAVRALGKRQVGELEPNELVITILISEIAAIPMQDPEIPLLSGVVPIVVLLFLGSVSTVLTLRFPVVRTVLYGKPSIVISEGRFLKDELKKLRVTKDEIEEELRLKDVADISDVKLGIIETNGRLSVILKPSARPLCKGDVKK